MEEFYKGYRNRIEGLGLVAAGTGMEVSYRYRNRMEGFQLSGTGLEVFYSYRN
jgi:hypothetical protein